MSNLVKKSHKCFLWGCGDKSLMRRDADDWPQGRVPTCHQSRYYRRRHTSSSSSGLALSGYKLLQKSNTKCTAPSNEHGYSFPFQPRLCQNRPDRTFRCSSNALLRFCYVTII